MKTTPRFSVICIRTPILFIAATLAMPMAIPSAASAAISDITAQRQDALLAAERWSEQAFGISLRPPLGATLHQATADDALLRIAGAEGYSAEVYLRQVEASEPTSVIRNPAASSTSAVQLTIDQVVAMAMQQVNVAHPSAVLMDRDNAPLDDLPSATLYFRIKDPSSGQPFILLHAYTLISHDSFVMVRSLVDAKRLNDARPILEAMLASMRIEDPDQRDARRRIEIELGQAVRDNQGFERLAQALPEEQWYRLLKGSDDIGHLRLSRKLETRMGYPGLTVTVQAHAQLGGQSVDSLSEMFVSRDGEQEIWSTKTTTRPQGATPGGVPQDMTVIETGVRSGNRITVTREDRGQKKSFEWQAPPAGYLSQAELYLLPPLLPKAVPASVSPDGSSTLGFYAYYPSDGQITYRTATVTPDNRGGTRVTIHPSPNSPFETLVFDADGALAERQLPNNQRIIPSTRRQILAIGGAR